MEIQIGKLNKIISTLTTTIPFFSLILRLNKSLYQQINAIVLLLLYQQKKRISTVLQWSFPFFAMPITQSDKIH